MKNLLFVALTLAFVTACGPAAVGQKCTTNADCTDSNSCFNTVAGGFCSRGCTAQGTVRDCPDKTACAQVASNTLVCSNECTDDTQCNTALRCLPVVDGSTTKVCRQP